MSVARNTGVFWRVSTFDKLATILDLNLEEV